MTDARLQHWLSSHRDAVAAHPSDPQRSGPADHIDVDTLARFAAGQLSSAKARMVNEHLLACDDGRCGGFVRSQAVDVDVAGGLLYQDSASGEAVMRVRERTFQSREIIWSTFESLARELDAPIDELVNEAMAAYAKVRGYPKVDDPLLEHQQQHPYPQERGAYGMSPQDHDPLEETHDAGAISALDRSYSPPALARSHAPPLPPPPAAPPPPRGFDDDDDDLAKTAARGTFTRPSSARDLREPGEESRTSPRYAATLSRPINMAGAPPPPPPPMAAPPPPRAMGGVRAGPPSMSGGPPPLPPRLMPPTTLPMPGAPPRENVGTKRLMLLYQGRTHSVEKERYLLGRSKTQADLRLDDPNVSRQHAVIERVGSAWYIVDLGSTNGVTVAGERVARRALQDGDVIVITSHEIRCTLR